MAITNGKLEGLITVPAGDWTIIVYETLPDLAKTITFTAGETYYHSSVGSEAENLPDTIATKLAAAGLNGTFTCTVDATEGGTGKYTLNETTGSYGNVTYTFELGGVTSTTMAVVLGFTGDLSGAEDYVSPNAAKGLWLADGPHKTPYGDSDPGWDEADTTSTESPAGNVKSITYQRKVATEIMWHSISRAKCRIDGESTTWESFQQFHRDVILQEAGGFIGSKVRYYGDADTDGTYLSYAIPGMREFRPEPLRDGWIERWRIILPRLVQVPS